MPVETMSSQELIPHPEHNLPLRLRLFQGLHPQLYPWIVVTPHADGGAELYDFITSTRLHLNPTAHFIVARLQSGNQSLGEIAAELAAKTGYPQQQTLAGVVRIYQALESKDTTTFAFWRYLALYLQRLRGTSQRISTVFLREFTRGMGGG